MDLFNNYHRGKLYEVTEKRVYTSTDEYEGCFSSEEIAELHRENAELRRQLAEARDVIAQLCEDRKMVQ